MMSVPHPYPDGTAMKSTQLLAVGLAALLVTTGVAAAGTGADGHDTVRIVDEEVTVGEATITISETSIAGPALDEMQIEDQTYTFSSTIHLTSLDVTHDGTTYLLCDVTIHIQEIGVHVEDVALSDTK